ncbi:hypothetical protein [Pseudomonas putida]|uniref:hypothetical protein n=1 Tax=Pseudomonas putida TaxID=303 RepID=UPI00059B4E8C|nr:hypothetical protein [Pseudomonas putida]
MSNGNQQAPTTETSSPSTPPNRSFILNKTLAKAITSSHLHKKLLMTAYYTCRSLTPLEVFLKYAPIKITSNLLRFTQLDTWAILNAAIRLKDEKFLLAELKDLAAQHQDELYLLPLVILADRRGRPAVPETTLALLRKALTPGKTIHGKKKMHVNVMVPETIWEAFLIKALGWWVESGTAPEHLVEIKLELDLGL